MASIPHKPSPPSGPIFIPSSSPERLAVHLTAEEMRTICDPKASAESKTKIMWANWDANHPPEPKKGGGNGGPPRDYGQAAYILGMANFAIDSRIWSEECSKNEAFRNKIVAIWVAEKKKAESGHYKQPEGRGR